MTYQTDINGAQNVPVTSQSLRPKTAMVSVRNKLERAARNRQCAHLDQNDLHALASSGVLELISVLAAKEIAECLEHVKHHESGLDHTGSNGARNEKSGKSPGMTEGAWHEHAACAASRRASKIVDQIKALPKRR